MTIKVFLDTEAVTLACAPMVIWEVGLIRRSTGIPEDRSGDMEYRFQLRPNMGIANGDSLRISGFHERFVVPDDYEAVVWRPGHEQKVLRRYDALTEIAYLLEGAHVYGIVPSFDFQRLAFDLSLANIQPGWHYQLHDVQDIAAGFVAGRRHFQEAPLDREALRDGEQPPYDDEHLPLCAGFHPQDETTVHTALGDARYVRDLYDWINS